MIDRFLKVTDNLYRGGAPTDNDVIFLKKKFGINKIISLDLKDGLKIKNICKLLNINHIMLPLDTSRKSILNILQYDLKDLLTDNGPTFIHCSAGKDRTGFIVALFKVKYLGVTPKKALEEAEKIGFGKNVPHFKKMISLYEKIIKNTKSNNDVNNVDIVSNHREYLSDNRSSILDEAHQGSFAPYLSPTKQFPYDIVYNPINDQSGTRENYDSVIEVSDKVSDIPQVGIFNNDAGIHGCGPVENAGGFIFD